MENSRIQDIPSFKKTLDDIKKLKSLKAAMPLLKPLLRILGVNVNQMQEAFTNFDELERQAQELATLPDRFNDLFSARGWIIYDLMKLDVAKAAVEKAESGDVDGAEADLVEYYDAETVEWLLRRMNGVQAFIARMPLAKKALIDYREERYHACVPVILALLDGLVNELHEKRRGFFSEEVDLAAWDSVAAHDKGLNALTKIFQTGRYTTVTEQITVPYRNGILHGMDLGYDNRMVAAKTWAALFATRDWSLRVEQGLLTAPAEEPKTTWRGLFQQIRENAEEKARLEEWKPRTIRPGANIPATGEPDVFAPETPEHKLAEYMAYWKARNYGRMAQVLNLDVDPPNAAPARVREYYASKRLKAFEFLEVADSAAALTMIKTKLVYEENGNDVERTIDFRLVNVDRDKRAAIRGKPESSWVIDTLYVC